MAQIPASYWAPSSANYSPSNPTAPASTAAYKMQGLAGLITPATPAGVVVCLISAQLIVTQTTVNTGINLQLYYGLMQNGVAAPANAASIPSNANALGPIRTWTTGVTLTTAADAITPITLHGVVQGLTPGAQYWFDVAAESVQTASACQLINPVITLFEA